MAELNVAVQSTTRAGLVAAYLDSTTTPALATGDFAGTGDQFLVPNDGRTFLHVKNGATDVAVTIQTPGTVDGLAVTDRVVTVAATSEEFIGPFSRNDYGDPFKFALDDVANVEIAAVRVGG